MSKDHKKLINVWMVGVLMSLLFTMLTTSINAANGDSFWIGRIQYEVIDEAAKTCKAINHSENDKRYIYDLQPEVIPEQANGYTVVAIADWAFGYNHNILSVSIPRTVKKIGVAAFMWTCNLREVTIHGCDTIGASAFYGSRDLTTVHLEEGVKCIMDNAFSLGENLKDVVIPKSVERLGDYVFYENYLLEHVTIRAHINKIPKRMFLNCGQLKRVDCYWEEIDSIDFGAFDGCTSLEVINIPNVKYVGEEAFRGCSCADIKFSDKLKFIGRNAFQQCYGMTGALHLTADMDVNEYAFSGCTNFESITVDEGVSNFMPTRGGNALVSSDGKRLLLGCAKTIIPEGVEEILELAFSHCKKLTSSKLPSSLDVIHADSYTWCENLREVTIPEKVTIISNMAFQGCSNLERVEILSKCNLLRSGRVFADCPNLKSIVVTKDNPYIDSRDDCNAIIDTKTNELIEGCKTTTIPLSVTSIGRSAFEGCTSLMTIDIPEGVQTIHVYAFGRCSGLEHITMPSTLTLIGDSILAGCPNLKTMTCRAKQKPHVGEGYYGGFLFGSDTKYKVDTLYVSRGCIDEYLTWKSWYANNMSTEDDGTGDYLKGDLFTALNQEGVSILYRISDPVAKTVVVGGGTTQLQATGEVADLPQSFKYIITIPQEVKGYRVSGIADHAFQGRHYIRNINLPEGLDSIGEEAFANCVNLDKIKFPSTLTKLGRRAFYFCERISGFPIIPDGVKDIPDECFAECHSMGSAHLPHGLETIGRRAFFQIMGGGFLFPATLKSIGEEAILGIASGFVNTRYRSASRTPIEIPESAILWFSTPSDLEEYWIKEQEQGLFVPEGCAEIYKNTPGWSKFWPCIFEMKEIDKCNVTYRLNGEEYSHDQADFGRIYVPNVEAPTAPEGYEFSGWMLQNYTSEEPIMTDLEIIGRFVPKNNTQVVRTLPVYDGGGQQCGTMDVNFLLTYTDGHYSAIVYKPRGIDVPQLVMEDDGIPAFDNVTGLSGTLCLPDSITDGMGFAYSVDYIGFAAFYGCDALKHIDFGTSVKAIGNMAFQRSALEGTLVIPENVNHLYHQVFGNTKKISIVVFRHREPAAIVWDKHGNKEDFAGPDATCIEVCQGIVDECATGMRSDNFAFWYRESTGGVVNSYGDLLPHQLLVNGVEVTLHNTANILGDGTVSYNADNQTLTLKGCNLTSLSTTLIGGLNIKVDGKNSIAAFNSYQSDVSVASNQGATGELTANELWAINTAEGCQNVLTIDNCKMQIGTLRGFTDLRLVGVVLPKKVFFSASQGLDNENLPQQNLFERFGATASFKHDVLIDLEKPLELPVITGLGKDFEVSFLSRFGYNAQLDDINGEVVDGVYFHMRGENADLFRDGGIYLGTLMTDDQMEKIAADGDLESTVFSEFSGMVIRVGAGRGIVTLNAATQQGTTLNVKVGTQQPVKLSSMFVKNFEVPYHTDEPCYVYIYTTLQPDAGTSANRRAEVMAEAVVVVEDTFVPTYSGETKAFVYGMKVHVDEMSAISAPVSIPTQNKTWYDLQGRKVDPNQVGKGIYIIDGRKYMLR